MSRHSDCARGNAWDSVLLITGCLAHLEQLLVYNILGIGEYALGDEFWSHYGIVVLAVCYVLYNFDVYIPAMIDMWYKIEALLLQNHDDAHHFLALTPHPN